MVEYLICEQNSKSVVDSIWTLYQDKKLATHILDELNKRKLDNTDEIQHYIKAIES